MKPRGALIAGALLTSILASVTESPAVARATGAGAYIVVLEKGADPDAVAQEHATRYGVQVTRVYDTALYAYAGIISRANLHEVENDPAVHAVTDDVSVTAVGRPSRQVLPTGVDRVNADVSSLRAGDGAGFVDADVAVIDSGIATRHRDLNVVGGIDCTGDGSYADDHGHGTHVAGTIAASDDLVGIVGVAPGARLWSVRVLDATGAGDLSAVLCGIEWTTENAATIEVANMSVVVLGLEPEGAGCATGDPLHDAVCRSTAAGVTYVAAAGNNAFDASFYSPASYDEVLTVSAITDFDGAPGGLGRSTCYQDADDSFGVYSNYGADVDLAAPGTCIESTARHGYESRTGTSMAAAHASGAAAVYLAANPGARPEEVATALRNMGSTAWDASDDPDGIIDPLVDLSQM